MKNRSKLIKLRNIFFKSTPVLNCKCSYGRGMRTKYLFVKKKCKPYPGKYNLFYDHFADLLTSIFIKVWQFLRYIKVN